MQTCIIVNTSGNWFAYLSWLIFENTKCRYVRGRSNHAFSFCYLRKLTRCAWMSCFVIVRYSFLRIFQVNVFIVFFYTYMVLSPCNSQKVTNFITHYSKIVYLPNSFWSPSPTTNIYPARKLVCITFTVNTPYYTQNSFLFKKVHVMGGMHVQWGAESNILKWHNRPANSGVLFCVLTKRPTYLYNGTYIFFQKTPAYIVPLTEGPRRLSTWDYVHVCTCVHLCTIFHSI